MYKPGSMYRKILNEDFNTFFEIIKKIGEVHAPVKEGSSFYKFKQVTTSTEFQLKYTRTMIPPKRYLIKEKAVVLEYDEIKPEFKEIIEDKKIIVLGVHSCDLHAMRLLDIAYLDENPDKDYATRRENVIFIGVDCEPDEYCFCQSTGTSYIEDSFDLFLHEINKGYLIRVGSTRGQEIIELGENIFKDVEKKDLDYFKSKINKGSKISERKINTIGLQDIFDLSYDHPVWKEIADICYGCGSCNLTCPTCRCFDVVDKVDTNLTSGQRMHKWDSCQLRKHGLVAGGLNFRPTRVERLQNRFNCKTSLREGVLNCVGCGRCTVYCPAKIDFVEIIKRVRGEL